MANLEAEDPGRELQAHPFRASREHLECHFAVRPIDTRENYITLNQTCNFPGAAAEF